MLVADDVRPQALHKKQPPLPVESLLAVAAERNALPLVEACRKAEELGREYHAATYGGSFSYWATNASGEVRPILLLRQFRDHGDPHVFRHDQPVTVVPVRTIVDPYSRWSGWRGLGAITDRAFGGNFFHRRIVLKLSNAPARQVLRKNVPEHVDLAPSRSTYQ
jgi:hypothetical protein